MDKKVVSVYGYGRFGKFWADILAKDFHVKVYSRRGLKKEEDKFPELGTAILEFKNKCDNRCNVLLGTGVYLKSTSRSVALYLN